jgi:hypothetical protein
MILNLTQHIASADQINAGVIDFPPALRADIAALLTFNDCPTTDDIAERANEIANMAVENARSDDHGAGAASFALSAMIGGAPWLMAPLANALRDQGIVPLFSFSKRNSIDVPQADGSVVKTAIFKHAGWLPA